MPPKLKVKKVIINKKVNDVLEKHFGGEISLIKGTKLTNLYDEGIIDIQMFKFLKAVKISYNKSERGDVELKLIYKLEEPPKIIIDDELNDILREHFNSDIMNIKGSTIGQLIKDKQILKTCRNHINVNK